MNRLLPLRWGLPSPISAFKNPTPKLRTSIHPRYYSKPPTSDPTTSPRLAKPTRYTPPSHPSRSDFTRTRATPQFPLHTPSSSSSNTKSPAHYPTTLPPPGTFSHWFLTSRRLHFYLSLGILTTLAAIASVTNFLRTSPYAKLVPEWRWSNPRECVGGFVDAVKMHWENESRVKER
ncbi:hypothetical protein L211DRAFT_634697 [Terfezia boudieri ATCC MYA-4762]|uniref:Uncharacterized protein n=1 Tax=Terfezia boudieri ATCC MYA-4762 TaxID=1051890 RepID=A0A3N4L957_9PEZI|nr:hypothetical protein L211DRAFT_634697 [Terfezia boudieri ATCC MYA-4762]